MRSRLTTAQSQTAALLTGPMLRPRCFGYRSRHRQGTDPSDGAAVPSKNSSPAGLRKRLNRAETWSDLPPRKDQLPQTRSRWRSQDDRLHVTSIVRENRRQAWGANALQRRLVFVERTHVRSPGRSSYSVAASVHERRRRAGREYLRVLAGAGLDRERQRRAPQPVQFPPAPCRGPGVRPAPPGVVRVQSVGGSVAAQNPRHWRQRLTGCAFRYRQPRAGE
jgi:hypothetical protein